MPYWPLFAQEIIIPEKRGRDTVDEQMPLFVPAHDGIQCHNESSMFGSGRLASQFSSARKLMRRASSLPSSSLAESGEDASDKFRPLILENAIALPPFVLASPGPSSCTESALMTHAGQMQPAKSASQGSTIP